MLIVVDPGNFSTKYFFDHGGEVTAESFSSVSHDYIPISDDTPFGKTQFNMSRVQYLGLDKYIGEDAKRLFKSKKQEKIYTGNTRKGHNSGLMRVVLALYKAHIITGECEFDLIVTSPVESRKKDKLYFENGLTQNSRAIIDNQPFEFTVRKLVVATEGLGAKEFVDHQECIIIDGGSQTTNILHFLGGQLTENSTTINVGTESASMAQIADTIYRELNNVDFDFPVRVTGGKAIELANELETTGFQNCLPIHCDCDKYLINGYGVLKMAIEAGGI